MKQAIMTIGAAILMIALFFLADPGFHSVEKRIYSQYAQSLVEDFDLNVVNQIPRSEAWLLTKTLNYPDVHSNGTSVLWAPFFLGAKSLETPEVRAPYYRVAQTVANVFWGLMAALLIWLLLRRFYSTGVSSLTLALLLIGTPFFWHLVYQPENADITSLFWAVALLHLYCERDRFKPATFACIFGAALFAGVAVKFDLIFNGLLFVHWIATDRRAWLRRTSAFAAGSALMAIPIVLNESLKSGFLDYAYFDTATPRVYILFENLFAPSGIFYAQPFWLLLLGTAFWLGDRKKAPAFYWVILLIPLTELVLESFTYNQNETVAARHWVNDLGLFALVLGQILTWLKGRARVLFAVSAVALGLVSVVSTLVYRLDFDAYFFSGAWGQALSKAQPSDFLYLITPHAVDVKVASWGLIFAAMAIVFMAWRTKEDWRKQPATWVSLFAALAAAYWFTTGGNLVNNAKSAAEVPERVKSAVIGDGPHINSFFENAGCLQRAVEYYDRRGDHDKALGRRRLLEDYVQRAANEIIRDPVGFKQTLVPGRDVYVPRELWNEQ